MKTTVSMDPEEVARIPADTLAKIHEVAATLIFNAAREVGGRERFEALQALGVELDLRAAFALKAAIHNAVIGVEFPDSPVPYFDDPSLPEEVRYQ